MLLNFVCQMDVTYATRLTPTTILPYARFSRDLMKMQPWMRCHSSLLALQILMLSGPRLLVHDHSWCVRMPHAEFS